MIENRQKAYRKHVHACATKGAMAFDASVRPIFGSQLNGRPEHVGSCILLAVEGRRILSTAAHVADHVTRRMLFLGGPVGTAPVPLGIEKWKATSAPGGDRRRDHYDCAFLVVPDTLLPSLGAVEFLTEARLSPNLGSEESHLYTALGYPVSRNKDSIDHATRSITNRRSIYTGSLVELSKLAAELGVTGAEHLFLRYEKHAYDLVGQRLNSIKPTGMSGGALLDIGDFGLAATLTQEPGKSARLSGMLIEHYKSHKVMVAVKIGYIVRGIKRALQG